jgi:hypothetical protein
MTDVIGGDGTPYLSGSSEFAPGLWDENTLWIMYTWIS